MANYCSECGKKFGFLLGPVVIQEKPYCRKCASDIQTAKRAELEQEVANAIISTTSQLDGYKATRYLGTVSAFSLLKLGVTSDWFADFGDLFGGKSSGYANKFAGLQADVEAKLKLQSITKGGNAVIGARFDVEFIETGTGEDGFLTDTRKTSRKLFVSGSGTAVHIEPTNHE